MITITKVGLKRLKTSGKYCSTDVDINVNIPTYDETITSIYSITSTCTHCTASGSNPTSIETGTTATLTFTAESGCLFPDNITVVGATGAWTKETGTLVLSNATGNVSIAISAFNPTGYSRVGGRIFYIHDDNGATYEFRTQSGALVSTLTIAGLENAYYYKITSGTPTADKFYVFNNELATNKQWGKKGTTFNITSDGIGLGKTNSATCLATTGWEDDSIWAYINTMRTNQVGGCNDWYIGSKSEQDQLRASILVDWYSNHYMWSSVEYSDIPTDVYHWDCYVNYWSYYRSKDDTDGACVGIRSF